MSTKSLLFKGAVASAALAGAAAWWLNSESGQETKEQLQDSIEDFNDEYVQPNLKKLQKIGYRKFRHVMKKMALRYGSAKDMSEEKMDALMAKAQEFWDILVTPV
jgi:hypothetical protein